MPGYDALRPLLFRLDAERAHLLNLRLLALAGLLGPARRALRQRFAYEHPTLAVQAFGLKFANPIGLAAGYDKDGVAMHALACLGFGHLEVGTVTPQPQRGNPRPRVFRLPEDRGLINRMGFPGAGAQPLARRLARGRPERVVLGVNLGMGWQTPLEKAADDYLQLLNSFYGQADYLAINVSSPNTLGLRRLQARDRMERLLEEIRAGRATRAQATGRQVPILVKLSPDLGDDELEDAVGAILAAGMDGVIACNTTLDRQGLRSVRAFERGGLSGEPLRERSTQMIRRIVELTDGRLPVVGVGGVMDSEAAREKLAAGAVLVQLFTGLVYRGPGLVQRILRDLAQGEVQHST